MEPTGISINKESWALLRDEPLYSARFIDRTNTDELALVVRVEALEWFLGMQPPLLFDLVSWRSPRGVWVVILSYQLRSNFGPTKGGSFYLNPRQSTEADLLRKLTVRDSLPVVFLSEDCETHYTTKVLLDPQVVAVWRGQIDKISLSLSGKQMIDGVDAEFETAVHELQMEEP
jgi:hypothetical protein